MSTIADSITELRAINEYSDFMRSLFRNVRLAHESLSDVADQLDELQARVTNWQQADPDSVQAKLLEIHLGLIPTELNPLLGAIRTRGNQTITAIEQADTASEGQWFHLNVQA